MTNPYVTTGDVPAAAAAPAPNPYVTTGPARSQRGVGAPEAADRLPRVQVSSTPQLWWVGVHGGAGEHSLRRAVGDVRGSGHAWPIVEGSTTRAVAVCRSNQRGLAAAQAAAIEWASGQLPGVALVGLVVIADAPGRLPRPLRELRARVAGGFPRMWTVPWSEAWRLGDYSANDPASRAAAAILNDLGLRGA